MENISYEAILWIDTLIYKFIVSLFQGDYNVIVVDWGGGARVPLFMYENSASNTRVVSAYLAKLMDMVVDRTGYDMSNVHCIGYSYGSHVCGFTSKRISTPFGRITGEFM